MEDAGDAPYVLRAARALTAEARALAACPVLGLSVRARSAAIEELARARRALQAAHLALVRSLGGADLTEVGATSLAQLLTARLKQPPGRSRADVEAARATDPDTGALPGLGAALANGEVSRGHVDVAVAALMRIPVKMRAAAGSVLDSLLAEQSRGYRPRECEHLAKALLDRIDPDRADRGYDPDALVRRALTLTTDAFGMVLVRGQLDALTGARLKAAVDHYAKPVPAQTGGDGRILLRDERTPAQRRADALGEIATRALAAAGAETGTRGGQPPRVVVHATVEQVRGRAGAGFADCEQTGPVSKGALGRVLCDCLLERVLLAPNGAVLNLGRTMRTAGPAQRRALAARDRGCIWPGCTIPARWAEAHHVPGWIHGSRTDVDQLCLLCGPHHSQVEAGTYRIVMRAGIPHVIPPTWIDPDQTPVRNLWWDDQDRARAAGEQILLVLDPPDDG